MDNEDLGFTYHASKQGEVRISHHGRFVTILRGEAAQEFVETCDEGDFAAQQQLMARMTGNYKHGNERTASKHPRNRGTLEP
jgi:hypothetical protein